MTRLSRAAVLAVFAAAALGALPADVVIVSEGQPRAEIVLAEREATGPMLFAAEELRRYIEAMSGASLPLVPSGKIAGVTRILLTAGLDGDDHYHLRASDDRVTIAGSTPRAVLFGAYDLLERLGCGWCVPGDDTVPKRSTISVPPMDVDTAPAFRYRMMLDFPLMSVAQSIAIVDWIAKNRMNWVHPCPNAKGEPTSWYERRERVVPEIRKRGLQVILGGHTMHTWVPPEEFKEHPEWFAFLDGDRKPPALCITNAEMTAELIRNMERFLDRCPEVAAVDLWHPDEDAFCHCSACTQGLVPGEARGRTPEGTPADAVRSAYVTSYIRLVNRVAEAIGRSHPGILLSPLIYGPVDRARPDGSPPFADNVLLALAHICRDSYRPLAGEPASAINLRFLGNDLTWMAGSKHHYIYEYYNAWVAPFIYPGAQVIVLDLRLLRKLAAHGASSDMYGYTPCNMVVAARALWSPDISWQEAVRDFHLRYYGDAGREMAENAVAIEKGVFGKAGYQPGGALNEPSLRAESGEWFNEIRPRQIEFLEGLIARSSDPRAKTRLERALKPWKMWGADARWWAFPPFEASP